MSEIMIFLFCVAAICYLLSASGSFSDLKKTRAAVWGFSVAGFLAQAFGLGFIAFKFGRMPVATSYELSEAIVCVSVFFFMASSLFFRMKIGAFLFYLFAAAFSVLPVLCPKFFEGVSAGRAMGALSSVHVVLAVSSYALLAFSASLGGMYMLSRRLIKGKSNSLAVRGNLSLEKVARLGKLALFSATFLMFFSILAGGFAALGAGSENLAALKLAAGGVLFLMMLLLSFFSRFLADITSARLCVLLFAVSILLLIPIEMRTMQ